MSESGIEQESSENRYNLMIIDNKNKDLQSYATKLSEFFNVICIDEQEQARALLNKTVPPDVVLLDVVMPDGDGIAFCRSIREQKKRTRNMPIVFLSSIDEQKVKTMAFDAGASDFVVGSAVLSELISRIRFHASQYRRTVDLETLIDIDPLTHLPNATKFSETLEREWARCARYWHHLSLLLIKLDNTVSYEQKHGSAQYYALIASLAHELSSIGARPGDVLSSIEEGCFALLLSDCSTAGARLKAEQILDVLSKSDIDVLATSQNDISCKIAVGVSAPSNASSYEALYSNTHNLLDKDIASSDDKFLVFEDIIGVQ